ncbi:acyl-CoA-binding protein, putative [Plasmodium berghei]|uniref:Acyl-CoA-binding protein, putative n=2 Tax=Plasmodium berghei TaxID=5821 RepID=A0A509ALX2_PLABA|nr:acyl-CoA-binding protein, putative [Plasmodium berghei ANKA]CXI44126.1 acyl-CoA-binding protein, putative [Plasmodium berghei]SCM22459.1 acyl-CoA-binding protein, putative [Plasmodium berghei]SCN25464.1 acyl-CoA-binding protein, putative [Plasmodium berghei]SCO60426.1 acyl-CoA-binding protein, putative [Plasmodium berghei]SCO62218.1 acyl-CoA-binding protein, putative [Plasmodium berghei]|eukprot:XP_034421641.1 acyl-CoA-binding protein, putative [Plasmodium berghei ANKA]
MLLPVRKSFCFFNIASTIAIIYVLNKYNRDNDGKLVKKLKNVKEWLIKEGITLYRKYRLLKIPKIDKNVIINMSDKELEEKFAQACNDVKIIQGKLKFEQWIYLYGLYKQITSGNIKNDSKSSLNFNDEMIKTEQMNAWKNCYGVSKKVCKYLYVKYFNELFPKGVENSNTNFQIDLKKNISKMKPLTDRFFGSSNTISKGSEESLSDILCNYIVSKNMSLIKKTIKAHPDLINAKNRDGLTPLHYACDRGFLDIVKFLIKAGANINEEDSLGDSVLHIAAYSGKMEIIKFLINAGVNIHKKNAEGLTYEAILSKL